MNGKIFGTGALADTPGNLNIVHLVSLEGFDPFLVDAPSFPAQTAKVRLVSLASWSFTCLSEEGENFADLMLGLVGANEIVRLHVPDILLEEAA